MTASLIEEAAVAERISRVFGTFNYCGTDAEAISDVVFGVIMVGHFRLMV